MTPADLVAWRKRMGWTQPQAAEALNTPVGTYRGWEQGRFEVPGVVDVAVKLLEETRVEIP